MKKLLSLFILMHLPMLVSANDGDTFSAETIEGILLKYTVISESEKTCMVGFQYEWPVPTSYSSASRVSKAPNSQISGDITIPEEASGYRVVRIEDYAFNQAAITSVYIPNSVETIGSSAFTGCTDLKSVRLPMQLKSIESFTFYCCESLTSIDIPESVTSIGEYAFACCKQLKEAIIPSGVEHFGEDIFWNTGFTSLPKLPENLTTIPNGMFYQCTQLTSIEIPQNITRIGDTAFGRCPISEIEIPASVVHIGVAAFANCKNLTNIVIPDNVTSIGMNGFLGCSGLKTITLSNNLSSLSKGVFSDCTSLESINIPSGVKTIGEMAFMGCSSLNTISIPETVESIDSQVFFGCSSLAQLFIPKSVVNFKINKDDNWWQYSYRSIIYGCNSLTSLIVDKENPVYDSRNNCNAIIETASNTLIVGCAATKIPEGITTIGLHAFDGFQNLASITLPRSLNIIELGAFNGTGLREIKVPENVNSIGAYAFAWCNNLKDFYCYAEKAPEAEDPVFNYTNIKEVTLHVPAASVGAYQAVEPWKDFKKIVALTPQDDYRPFVEEGKHWTYDNFMPLRPAEYDHYYYYDLKGGTLIAGRQCLKMYSDTRSNDSAIRYEGALYEENKKVYCFFPGKEEAELLYDFDCVVGDTLNVYIGQLVVTDIQSEALGDITIKKYTLQPVVSAEEQMGEIFWIEGVGATKDFFGMLPLPGNYNTLNACELNGEMLYQKIEQDLTEEGYHRMAIEGKRWNYIHYYIDEDGEHYDPYSYVVKGDTVIRRTTYKKLYYQDEKTERFECLLLETGRTVYKNTDLGNNSYDSTILTSFFDFDRNDFGRVFTWKSKVNSGNTNWMPYGVDTIQVNNRQFRRFTCLQKYSKDGETLTTIEYGGEGVWNDIWVEGVGSASSGIEDQYPPHEPPMRTPGEYTAFVSCYEDGECIFTAEDFTKLGSGDTTPQMAYYYYKGTKIPLTLNESKVCVNIPKECKGTSERVQANAKVLTTINDDTFDIFVISRSDFEKLTSLDSWKEDSKSVILTSVYFTERNEKVYSTPHLYVKLKKEQDIDLLKSYAEKYKLRIVKNVPSMPLWYILSVTLESEKSPLECANELWETGYFASSEPDFAADNDYWKEEPYRPFVEEGKVWKVGTIPTILGNPVQIVDYYYFDGDTIIDGKSCKLMMCQRYVSPDYSNDYWTPEPSLNIVGAWYEEGKKVYFYNTEKGRDHWRLKYDFSLDADETVCLFDDYPPFIIGPRQTGGLEGFKGVYRDVMINQEIRSTIWLEGVGGLDAPFRNAYPDNVDRVPEFLMSCTVGDEVIYLNDEYEDGATPESMEAKKNRFDFTHTIKTKPHAPRRNGSGDAEESEMQPLYGEYNDLQLGIHLNSLDDTYLVRITNESGQVVYEKTINAGNIVALSIDISAYAKGRYTVTLENNRESFTGEFEAQTTGIEAITNNKEVIRHNIYNLQGQRLSSLQKGLNIVNGQKIFVK